MNKMVQDYLIPSNSTPGLEYSVYNSIHKGWRCECKWFSVKGTECRHIREAKTR